MYIVYSTYYSRCPGLPASSLPVCPVYRCFFFVPPRHPGLPVVCRYTGVVHFFMLAEPLLLLHTPTHAAAHQHNTTRWVLRAAASTCLHTMPCAAGELCQLSDSTTTQEFSCCGPCGGRLNRICGDPDDEEVNRICEPCAAAKKSTSSTNDHSNAAKRKEGGGILQQSAPKKRKGETRKRLTLEQKREILQLLDQKVSRVEVARRFNCGVSTVGDIKKDRATLQEDSTAGVFPGISVYRFALFTGSFWSCHYRPVNRDIDCTIVPCSFPTSLLFFLFFFISLINSTADGSNSIPLMLVLMVTLTITKDLPISPLLSFPRFTPYNFLSRCIFSTLKTRQPMVGFYFSLARSHALR